MNKLNGVEDTLFIPLVGRIYSSKNYQEFFYDEKALELEQYIPENLIKENTGEYFTIAAIARYYEFDKLVQNFIKKYPNSNIISLGCGLETMYFRINSKTATFYEVDLPKVIEQRKIALPQGENEIFIGSNILDYEWMDKIDQTKPCMVIVSGVFQYLHHEDVVNIIKKFKNKFNNIEIAFDATNKIGIKKAQEYVHKTGNNDAMMYFYCNNIKSFAKETDTTVINKIPFYRNSSKILKHKLSSRVKMTCFFGDKLGFTKIIHLKIN